LLNTTSRTGEDERSIGYADRKAALREQVARAAHEALMVFAADKIPKVRELRPRTPGHVSHPVRSLARGTAGSLTTATAYDCWRNS
jgi:hypothetical protein